MIRPMTFKLIFAFVLAGSGVTVFGESPSKGILLENLTWIEAEKVLTPDTVVVIPLGAESKEHGPHLKLKNDFLIAEYLKKRVLETSNVVVAPTINYSFYPAFLEYPGSTSMMLYMAPESVDMKKAVKDYNGSKPGGLTRDPNGKGTYSPTGVWGDATLATREKGRIVTEALVKIVIGEIQELRNAPVGSK